MAKKTTPTPNPTFTLSKEQFQVIKNVSIDLSEIRRQLDDLKGENDISTIMFEVGQAAFIANKAEDQLDDIVNSFDEYECEECGDDNF
jgi:hypothetical protein